VVNPEESPQPAQPERLVIIDMSGPDAGPHTMKVPPAGDASVAQWAKGALDPYTWSEEGLRVKSLVPEGYEAYVRLFYKPWYLGHETEVRSEELGEELHSLLEAYRAAGSTEWPPQDPEFRAKLKEQDELHSLEPTLRTWRAIAESNGKVAHPNMEWHQIASRKVDDEELIGYGPELDFEELALIVETLRPFTPPSEPCVFLVWEGYGVEELQSNKAPRIDIGHPHLIFEGTLDSALGFVWNGWEQPPNMWWPQNRAWCVASEIDLDTAVIGGSRELIEAFLEHPQLECLPVSADDPIHGHADFVNGGESSQPE